MTEKKMSNIGRFLLLAGLAIASLASCTWVSPDEGGAAVRVAYASDDVANCARLGEITVSVKDDIAGIDRSETKVRDELESLARNQGATMSATHVLAVDEPHNGEQRYEAFDCR